MLPDLQELTPIHSSNCLSAGKGTHGETNAHPKEQAHSYTSGLLPANQPVYSLNAFSMTVVNELEDIFNVELYNQLIGQFEPAQYIF